MDETRDAFPGFPQGCVLSSLLFSLFTNEFNVNGDSCVSIKYAKDTVLAGLITGSDESDYRNNIDQFVNWCVGNYLVLNV